MLLNFVHLLCFIWLHQSEGTFILQQSMQMSELTYWASLLAQFLSWKEVYRDLIEIPAVVKVLAACPGVIWQVSVQVCPVNLT